MSTSFDPYDYQDPAHELTLRVRGLRVGQSTALADGTVIKSVPMKHGAAQIRRFAVAHKGASPPRAGIAANTHASAEEAARAALGRKAK